IASLLVGDNEDSRDRSILDILPHTLPPDLQNNKLAGLFFTSQLKKGNCLILFDGLDEVPTDDEFQTVKRAIESLVVIYPKNQFIVTSRIAGWRTGVGADFKTFYIDDLTKSQTETFIDTWYDAVERNAVVGPLDQEGVTERNARFRRATAKASDLKNTL